MAFDTLLPRRTVLAAPRFGFLGPIGLVSPEQGQWTVVRVRRVGAERPQAAGGVSASRPGVYRIVDGVVGAAGPRSASVEE